MIFSAEVWDHVNRYLVAKSLQELGYEQVFSIEETSEGNAQLVLENEVTYRFQGWRGIWGDFKVDPQSIERWQQSKKTDIRAAIFFKDTQTLTGMDDIILGNFFEEMHNTLYADMGLFLKQKKYQVEEVSRWDGLRVQSILNGHPKLLLNKGRFTWGASDQELFAPENEKTFQLGWLAIQKSQAALSLIEGLSWTDLLLESFDQDELHKIQTILAEKKISLQDFVLVPIHPWQWDRFVQTQFAEELSQGIIYWIGLFGDLYQPQISLRTLSNISRPGRLDIKLPLTILNTSSVRGIPERYISKGPALSKALRQICQEDAFLGHVQVLEEKAGVSLVQTDFQSLSGAPYRYHELLGAIWRESSEGKLQKDERAILAGSLAYSRQGKSLLSCYAKQCGLSLSEWVRAYFKSVVLPLYHLQLKHGIGLVSHGQNIVVKLKNGCPEGLFLKDFQGDLRLSENSPWKDLPAFSSLTRLPPAYLIHDLYTGHFVTVLRFISEALSENDDFSEKEFYGILSECISDYLSSRPDGAFVNDEVNLLAQKMPRVLVNRVRFQIGYADSSNRPLPILGEELRNPLFRE